MSLVSFYRKRVFLMFSWGIEIAVTQNELAFLRYCQVTPKFLYQIVIAEILNESP